MSASFFDEARQSDVVCLVQCAGGRYTTDEDTLAWIAEHSRPFAIVACAGKYRTGKSFLLNRLARASPGSGFGVGDSVQACTKGLWVYKQFFDTGRGHDLLFVDTEGIDSLDVDDAHDAKIFTLALLLSTSFIYNSTGHIDEAALQTLSLMTRVTENVRLHADSSEEDSQDISAHMPRFYWVLRDFSLRIVDKGGTPLTPDQYLENALDTGGAEGKCQVRGAIRKHFPSRHLLTLQRPATDDSNTQMLEDRPMSVSGKFSAAVEAMRRRVFDESAPISAAGRTLSGAMFAELCRYLVRTVQGAGVPVIRDSWTMIASVHARDLKDALASQAEARIAGLAAGCARSVDRRLAAAREDCLVEFDAKAMEPVDGAVRAALAGRVDELVRRARERLVLDLEESARACADDLGRVASERPSDLPDEILRALEAYRATVESDCDADEVTDAWYRATAPLAMERWLPRAIQRLESQREELVATVEASERAHKAETSRLDDVRRERLEEAELEAKEARLKIEALEERHQGDQEDLRHLRTEVVRLEVVRAEGDAVAPRESAASTTVDTHAEDLKAAEEEVAAIRGSLADVELALDAERTSREGAQRANDALNEELEATLRTHAQLEESWQKGLEEIKDEHERRCSDVRRREAQCRSELEARKDRESELLQRIAGLEHRLEQMEASRQRESTQTTEQLDRSREQCEKAQQRVLDIHRSMLADLKGRDERAREEVMRTQKERIELEMRLTEALANEEGQKAASRELKRRVDELAIVEIDHKKMRTSLHELEKGKARQESEVAQLRGENSRLRKEAEETRKQTLVREREVAICKTQLQLEETRRGLSR